MKKRIPFLFFFFFFFYKILTLLSYAQDYPSLTYAQNYPAEAYPQEAVSAFHAQDSAAVAYAQNYAPPLKINLRLSANFGELRDSHFHSGIDIKTNGSANQPVYAVADGYISRISISPGGFGHALYIDHPDGHTSVYGHLNAFSPKIAEYAEQKQYELERFRIQVFPHPDELPVKKGEQIALSGNTGSSGGPHLHFEIRDTRTQDPLDVLDFFGNSVVDTQKPDIRGIAFYPVKGKGVVNGSSNPLRLTITKNKSGVPLPPTQPISAWGRIGVGVKAYDRMDGQSNIYGIKHVRLVVDEQPVFRSTINRFSFSNTRMLNSHIDFEEVRNRNSYCMKSFVEPGNTLPFYETVNNGFIDICEERDYHLRYELEDYYGNTLIYPFVIKGMPQPVPQPEKCSHFMAWNINNTFVDVDFSLHIPTGNLYDNFCFTHSATPSADYLSDIHQVNLSPVPLHESATLWIKTKTDIPEYRSKYGIVKINPKGRTSWMGGKYKNSGVETTLSELGQKYAIDLDTVAPRLVPQTPEKWVANRRIRIAVTDDKSGIRSFRGEIDGKFALFSHDIKSRDYLYVFDDKRLTRGQKHQLVVTATDAVENTAVFRYEFVY